MKFLYYLIFLLLFAACGDGKNKKIVCSAKKLENNAFCDEREGRAYKYTDINGSIWMAENLRFGKRINEDAKYTWAEALGLPKGFNSESYYKATDGKRGICPNGWHIPNNSELNYWVSNSSDDLSLWSSTQNTSKKGNAYFTENGSQDLQNRAELKTKHFAVRCVKNDENQLAKKPKPSPSPAANSAVGNFVCQNTDANNASPLSAEEKQMQDDLHIEDSNLDDIVIWTSIFNNIPHYIPKKVKNNSSFQNYKVTFEYWLDGNFSTKASLTKNIPPNSAVDFNATDFTLTKNAFGIKNNTKTILQTCAYGMSGRKVPLTQKSDKIKLIPPQFFQWSEDLKYIAAFSTYAMDSMPSILRGINRKVGAIISYQQNSSNIDKEVKAAYDVIKNRKLEYIGGFSFNEGQKVKYPIETLREKRANCIEAALLFSAVLEAMGIETGIVFVPGHAFLAWKSKEGGKWDRFIETTMALSSQADYEQASDYGMREARKMDIREIVDIKKSWNLGVNINEIP